MKYSDLLTDWLVELDYTHCFFVAGGNIMHLLESCSRRFKCIPVVHEVAAGVAAEYFTEVSERGRAFALVTAGPGLTNIVTAIAGAYLESRELLVIGGQVKVADLARGRVRQRGIQEVDGVEIVRPITVRSELLLDVIDRSTLAHLANSTTNGRKGPVFLEIPLDIQGRDVSAESLNIRSAPNLPQIGKVQDDALESLMARLRNAERPIILIGGGVERKVADRLQEELKKTEIPLMTTWNGVDRIPADHPLYMGRPNTWGQRSSNIILQQADLLVALGTRLGLQQTGFNWQRFIPVGEVIQVESDPKELQKGHPHVALPICGDANAVLEEIVSAKLGNYQRWLEFCRFVRIAIPPVEQVNQTGEGYLSPFLLVQILSRLSAPQDIVIPCSSGGAYTVMMQAFDLKRGQVMVNNKGLAAMGYGLSGAIGAAFAAKGQRTILVEGDGGFMQNLQELGTVAINRLNIKIFLFSDNGYASIRMTQSNYFGGRYVGCDQETGLGIPKWDHIFAAYDIPLMELGPGFELDAEFLRRFNEPGPVGFVVRIDPNQTYFPKITSRITEDGSMASNPLHLMTPALDEETALKVFRYLPID
jgi:acetolactate synthase I/II/III large subunit